MKIAVNTRMLLRGKLDGIGWFTHEIMSRVVKAHPEHEFHFIFDRPYDESFVFASNVKVHVVMPQARHPWLFRLWYNWMVPRKLKQIGADIFVSPDMMLSLRTDCKQIVVLHDLNFEHYPEDLPSHISRYLRSQSPLFAQRADTIVTVSEFSKQDIVKQYGVDASKVQVVYNAPQEAYRVLNVNERDLSKKKWAQGDNYFVFISSIHPRKNLLRLLKAYDRFRMQSGRSVKLVAVGRRFWKNQSLDDTLRDMKFADDVIFTGHLEQSELTHALGGALALVYVSYFEGFGVPIVEAFRSGVPVITSNVTSMPEVAGDAALQVNPFNEEEIASAMVRIVQDSLLRTDMIAKGEERVKLFDWNSSAEKFWGIINETATRNE
jgi:glycosyltransferase involved in cell wall biosynthesis